MTGSTRAIIAPLLALAIEFAGCSHRQPEPLPLTGKVDGNSILLRWDPHAPAIADASSGKLTVTGGPKLLQRPLTKAELSQGSLIYGPEFHDVAITLEVLGRNGGINKGTLEVVSSPEAVVAEAQADRSKQSESKSLPLRPPGFPLPPRSIRE